MICSYQEANARARRYQTGPTMASAWSRLRVSRAISSRSWGEVTGIVFQLVLGPFAGDLLAPYHLEPGRDDGRLHGRLVHARRRVVRNSVWPAWSRA
jgi:hypothetical protein